LRPTRIRDNKMKTLVISGAYYYDKEMNAILIPHFTGEYAMVDCDIYLTKKDILEQYEKHFWIDNKKNFVEYEGVKYYYAEYSPVSVDEDWILLSDLSELRHEEENFNF
jgi:hypothetical protein